MLNARANDGVFGGAIWVVVVGKTINKSCALQRLNEPLAIVVECACGFVKG